MLHSTNKFCHRHIHKSRSLINYIALIKQTNMYIFWHQIFFPNKCNETDFSNSYPDIQKAVFRFQLAIRKETINDRSS